MSVRKAPKNPLSVEHEQAFDLYVQQWQGNLGLQGWRIERSKRKSKNMAEVEMHFKDRLAIYRTGDFGSTPINAESLESTALHELLHILLYGLVNQTTIGLEGEALEAEEHNVIHVLECLLMQQRQS